MPCCAMGQAWKQVQILQDVVLQAYASGIDARFGPAGYAVVMRNGLLLCDALVTDACVAEVGAGTCMQQAIASGTRGAAQGGNSSAAGSRSAALAQPNRRTSRTRWP